MYAKISLRAIGIRNVKLDDLTQLDDDRDQCDSLMMICANH